jgi:FixJ family two-component response regulator
LGSSTTISIVDDDSAVRLALSNLVRSLGWQARMFESAEAFLASDEAGSTSCLVCDIRMPGMSGIELHETLLARGCSPATIFVTAWPTPALEARVAGNGALVLLQKPYRAAVMTHWLSIALNQP